MTTGTEVKVNRNEHDCKNFEKFVLLMSKVLDLVGHGSVPCQPFLKNKPSIYFKDKSKQQETAEVL